MAIPPDTPDKITYFAETDYRSKRVKFGIRDDDRAKHMYIIGKTGMGKSTLLENLAVQDIQNGEGLCFIDPHGGTAETLLSYVPEHRTKDVIYFAPFDQEFPVALNVMEDLGRDKRALIVSGLIGAFKKVWVDAWSARMEYLLSNALLALLETPGSTLLGVNRMFADKSYRNMIVANITDPSVKSFWIDEYAKYSDKFATEATAAIQNKIGQFAANPLIRNMVGQPKSTFDIRKVMDERKILIVNLSKGRMGEGNANLVGSMLITKIYLAAMSRADVGAEVVKNLPPFYLYVDEFQSFANESFADILSEARKYKLSLTIAHQYIEQMSEEVRAAVFGNVGSMISFRVGAYDAEVLEKEFAPAFTAEDMVNLGFTQIYLKLMIRGVGSAPFSATTIPRPHKPTIDHAPDVITSSRALYARPRAQVEEEIKKWHEPIPDTPKDPNAPAVPETRKYAPGMRPQNREEGGRIPRAFPANGGDGAPNRDRQRSAPSVSLRSALQAVLPEQSLPVKEKPPLEALVDTPPRPVFTVPRAPYAPLSISPSIPAASPAILRPTPVVPKKPQVIPLPSQSTSTHQPFGEQFAKITSEDTPPSEKEETSRPTPPPARTNSFDNNKHQQQERMNAPATQENRASFGDRRAAPERRKNEYPLVGGAREDRGRENPDRRMNVDRGRPPLSVEAPNHRIEENTPLSAPLSLLKSSSKKDKGPSEKNLSNLRDVLRAASAKSEEKTATEAVPPPFERKELSQAGKEINREKERPDLLPPLEMPTTETPSLPPRSEQSSTPSNATPSTLSSRVERKPIRPMEIPEDVLRGVLAD